jgi:hypothetical protein
MRADACVVFACLCVRCILRAYVCVVFCASALMQVEVEFDSKVMASVAENFILLFSMHEKFKGQPFIAICACV